METQGREMKNLGTYQYLLPVRSILFLLIFWVFAFITDRKVGEISDYWSVIAVYVNIVIIAVLVILTKKDNSNYLALINYRKGQTGIKKTIITSAILAAIGMSGMYLSGLICYGSLMPAVSLKMIAPIPKPLAVINIILLPVTTTFAEDGLYLGGGVGHIKNKYLAIIIPAFFYALQHCFIPTLFDIKYMIYRFVSFLPLTVIFCIYFRNKKEPLPIMISHTLLDFATAISIFATSLIPGAYEKMNTMI